MNPPPTPITRTCVKHTSRLLSDSWQVIPEAVLLSVKASSSEQVHTSEPVFNGCPLFTEKKSCKNYDCLPDPVSPQNNPSELILNSIIKELDY